MRALVLLLALVQGPTPEPTPTPRATPTPEPRPPQYDEDFGETGRVTALHAPEDYLTNRHRGSVRYDAGRKNYSFHRVVLPQARPLVIEGCNFSQSLTPTVVFWERSDQGLGAASNATGLRVIPGGHNVRPADVGCVVRFAPEPGWNRGHYIIEGQNGTSWLLDRSAGANAVSGNWRLFCPVRDFTGITLVGCNLRNVWLPTALGPTLTGCQTAQGDLAPEPAPEPE